jgi:glycosyltransferase involved in cell wall biosynthesis
MPLVSVIIPCYNDGIYLDDAVQSVLRQTFTDYEILIVNDGSTDVPTLEKLASYNHQRIRVLHKANGHLSSARNHGIRHAAGTFIVTLDADDWFEKDFIASGMAYLQNHSNAGAVTCYLKAFGLKKYRWKPAGGHVVNFLYRQESCASAMFRKSCWEQIGGYDENMKSGYEDWEFWIRLTAAGYEVGVIPRFLLHYRITGKSMLLTQSEPRRQELIQYITEKHRDLYWQNMQEALMERKLLDLRSGSATILLLKNLFWKLKGR